MDQCDKTIINPIEDLSIISLSNILSIEDEKKRNRILRSFEPHEKADDDLKDFWENKAVDYQMEGISSTHLCLNTKMEVMGFFSLAIKSVDIKSFSKEHKEKIYPSLKDKKPRFMAYYLLGQLCKSKKLISSNSYSIGRYLVDSALEKMKEAKKIIGGSIAMVDAINNESIIKMYEDMAFLKLNENKSTKKTVKMIKYLLDD